MSTLDATDAQLRAVLWDMDGTLIDTEPLWLHAEKEMLSRYGIVLTPEISDRLVGSGLWNAAEIFRAFGVPLSADEIVAEWVESVSRGLAAGEPAWRPGAVELLASLGDAGIPSALVTMSVRSFADQVVRLLPDGAFRAIIAGDEVAHEKPHPDPYLRGADALGVPISACIALEDSPTGLRSAVASGAVAIGVPNILQLDDAPAHAIWESLSGQTADTLASAFTTYRPLDERQHRLSSVVDAARGVDS